MIRFTIDGEKHEFDDDHLTVQEVRGLKKYTGYSYREFWEAFSNIDEEALAGMVWLTRRRAGETDLKFSDVDFDFMEFVQSMETDDEPAKEEGGTDDEPDPTTAGVLVESPETPST